MGQVFQGQSKTNIRATARHVGFNTLKLLAIVVVVEVVLQLAAPQYANKTYDRLLTGGHPIAMNPDGYRGPVVPRKKVDGEVRILALGDSTTFGTGVAVEQTWPWRLTSQLSHDSVKVSCINAGLPAVHTKNMSRWYEDVWAGYNPDHVILAVSNNMISLAYIHRDAEPTVPKNPYLKIKRQKFSGRLKSTFKRAYGRFALPSWLSINSQRFLYVVGISDHNIDPHQPYGPMLAFGWKQADVPTATIDDAWAYFERDLAKLRDTVLSEGRSLIVTYIPSRFMIFGSPYDNEKWVPRERISIDPAHRVEAICRTLGLRYIDVTDALANRRGFIAKQQDRVASMYVLFDFTHLDGDGHQAVADRVFDAVMD